MFYCENLILKSENLCELKNLKREILNINFLTENLTIMFLAWNLMFKYYDFHFHIVLFSVLVITIFVTGKNIIVILYSWSDIGMAYVHGSKFQEL